jgi:glutathione S-transferase
MAPVKVFGPLLSPNVTRVILCLEEVGVEYEIVNVDFNTGEHKSPQHLQRNVRVQAPLYITVLAFCFGFDVFVARFHFI